MFFNLFKSTDIEPEAIFDDLYSGLEMIANASYDIFLESYNFEKNNFEEATNFETHVAALFYVDYALANKKVSQEDRKSFYNLAKTRIVSKFENKLINKNLSDILDHRYYEEYSTIPAERGDNWTQSFHQLYVIKLKGTENKNEVEKMPPVKTEGFIVGMHERMKFSMYETSNVYKALKLVEDLLAGRKIKTIIKDIKKMDSDLKNEFRKKGF